MGVNFVSKRTNMDIKSHFLKKLNPFSGSKYPNFMTCSLLQREIWWRHICKTRKATRVEFLHQACFHGYIDSCKVSLQSVDGNLDFWHPGLWSPPRAWRTTEKAGRDRVKNVWRRFPHSSLNVVLWWLSKWVKWSVDIKSSVLSRVDKLARLL